ncbi:MAG: hypothetical protein WBO98_07235, partial [Candidatus Nitrotoga sp.]
TVYVPCHFKLHLAISIDGEMLTINLLLVHREIRSSLNDQKPIIQFLKLTQFEPLIINHVQETL